MSERKPIPTYQFQIKCKSDDQGTKIDYTEPFSGTEKDAFRRAQLMWKRTSYVVGRKTANREVYASLEVWSPSKRDWVMVKEKKGRLPLNAPAPSES
jgi:hypothetical protein